MSSLRRGKRVAMLLAAMAIAASAPSPAAAVPEKLLPLLQAKADIAMELSKTVRACVVRQDTDHAAFRGCIDWHSSVHGVWALIAYSRATGDKAYEPLIAETLRPAKIEEERELLRSHRNFEMPYGRAWFLRLALEHRLHFQNDLLKPMADEVLTSLIEHFKRRGVDPRSVEYASASWALINMYDYARLDGNQQALAVVRDWIVNTFAQPNAVCDLSDEQGTFMAVCTNWAWLASRVLERDQLQTWLAKFFGRDGLPKPVGKPLNWHHYGLNFSRAWGLWEIYASTGDARFADAYVAHFREAYDDPKKWRGDYLGVGHWVPQFGMFAVQGLFGKETGR